jgi:hypothetical protein
LCPVAIEKVIHINKPIMKSKYLKINKACSEEWEQMKPNVKGSFCETCAKNVIDFTELSQAEIATRIKNTKGEICARVTKQQLAMPLIDLEAHTTYKLPYSNIAASILLASTLAISTTSCAQNEKAPTEFVQTSESLSSHSNIKRTASKPKTTSPDNFITFKGTVTAEEDGERIKNAKIMLVTIQKMFTTLSLEDGTFALEIPVEFIDDDNVIRVEYQIEKTKDGTRNRRVYNSEDYVLSKKEINSNYSIVAGPMIYYVGGIGHVTKKDPVIIQNQQRIPYIDYVKAQRGKKSSCNLENKDFMYFESEAAIAIYGKEAEAGLIILTDIAKK